MAFATVDDVVAALAASTCQRIPISISSFTTVANRYANLNAGAVGRWGQMATPAAIGAGGTLHAAGDAGFPPYNAPGGGNELRLLGASLGMTTLSPVVLMERIWSCSGMNATLNTPQNVAGFPALTIPDSVGTGLELFAEIYTQIGVTGTTITASYTNSANTAGRTSQAVAIGATGLREVYRLIPMPLQAGDTGVKSIASATLAATTGTAGNFGLVLARRLATLTPNSAAGVAPLDWATTLMPKLDSGAALMLVGLGIATFTGVVDGYIVLGEK